MQARLVASNLLQHDKTIAVWQDNQVFILDHTWDVAIVGANQCVDLVLDQVRREMHNV